MLTAAKKLLPPNIGPIKMREKTPAAESLVNKIDLDLVRDDTGRIALF